MAKLGDSKKPAIVRVATEERAHEIYALCENNGWKVVIGIEPDKAEDILAYPPDVKERIYLDSFIRLSFTPTLTAKQILSGRTYTLTHHD